MERKWEAMIYGEFSFPAQEKLLEIPLSAPYMVNQEDFRATNTSFEKDGQFFRAIKQRYQNDTLQVIVVPDTARGVLNSTVKKWISFLTVDEIPHEKNGKTVISLLAKDYMQPDKHDLVLIHSKKKIDPIEFIFSKYTNPVFQQDSPPPRIG